MKTFQITLVLCLILAGRVSGQLENDIALISKYNGTSIQLKVMPRNAHYWLLGIKNGYLISRRPLGSQDDFQPVHSGEINPKSEGEWNIGEKGDKWYEFHVKSVATIEGLSHDGDLFTAFKTSQRANENYKMYMLITMREQGFGELAGLELTDANVKEGEAYEYQVEIIDANIKSKIIRIAAKNQLRSPSLEATSLENAVRLTWIHDENLPILGYFIERSVTGDNYERMNDAPYLPDQKSDMDTLDINRVIEAHKLDSIGVNYSPYYYRLIAQDAWGDELPASLSVKSMGVDLTGPEMGEVDVLIDSTKGNFIIEWEPSLDSDLSSYFITQSFESNGVDTVIIQDIAPNSTYTYTVEKPLELKNYYFKVGAIDTSGNVSISESKNIFLPDNTPPTMVMDIIGTVDSSGIVNLSWGASHDTNLKGYWIYRSFKKDEDYLRITDTIWSMTKYTDTCSLDLLNNNVYYYIEALDVSFNRSTPSKVFEIVLPDTIPPTIGLLKDAVQVEDRIQIVWHENPSEDVRFIHIFRSENDQDWKLIQSMSGADTFYLDPIDMNGTYYYKIQAEDSSGNVGKDGNSISVDFDSIEKKDIVLSAKRVDSKIILNWPDIGVKYKLYRSEGNGFELLDYQEANTYEDENVEHMDGLEYYLKAYDQRGKLITVSPIIAEQ